MTTKICTICCRPLPLRMFGTQKYQSGNVAPSPRCKACVRAKNAAATALHRARKRGLAEPPAWSTRTPYVPPVDFLPLPPPLERVALVASL